MSGQEFVISGYLCREPRKQENEMGSRFVLQPVLKLIYGGRSDDVVTIRLTPDLFDLFDFGGREYVAVTATVKAKE